nr:ABC transporter permease [Corynebacterium choanae]
MLSGCVLFIALLWALVPQLFTHFDPTTGTDPGLLAPSTTHWFGTDAVGRDVYARVVYGTRQSLLGATIAVSLGMIVGTTIGVLAAAKGGIVDNLLMRIIDVLLSIPGLLLALSIVVLLGFGTINAAIAVGITSIATFARLSRAQALQAATSDYVQAAYGTGSSTFAVLYRHILPNSLQAVVALAAVQFGSAILQLSVLGFLGYGTPPPTPEWGVIIAEARDYVATSWWLTLLPGAVIVAVVLATNTISRALQRLD